MDLNPVKLGPAILEVPIYNGAGTVKKTEQVRAMAESNAGAVTLGSITFKLRGGNEGDVLWIWPTGSSNALGIPNPGYPYYKVELPEMVKICHDNGKPLYVNVQGDTPEEFGIMAELVADSGADGCEPNLACPNIWKDGTQKGIFGFYPELISEILYEIIKRTGRPKKFFKMKVPPYSNPKQLEEIAGIFKQHYADIIVAVVGPNTFANSFVVRREKNKPVRPAITFGKGFGGYAGPGYKPIALGQCMQWCDALEGSGIQRVGVGGIANGADAADYFQFAKVDAIQVVTALFREHEVHPPVFHRIIAELLDVPELPKAVSV